MQMDIERWPERVFLWDPAVTHSAKRPQGGMKKRRGDNLDAFARFNNYHDWQHMHRVTGPTWSKHAKHFAHFICPLA